MLISENIRWIGFDLDNTLHHFRRASSVAAEAVFEAIHEGFGTLIEDLRTTYKTILEDCQSRYFVDSRTSIEYRTERIKRLLNQHSIITSGQIEPLLTVYDKVLVENLTLTDGAESALKTAKERGFRTFVVSEGPHDAQETTIKRLGLSGYVDLLFTSSQEGISKSQGLIARAVAKIGFNKDEILYVGDSYDRDIIPALAAGIKAIQLDPERPNGEDCISSLMVLTVAIRQSRAIGNPKPPDRDDKFTL